MKNHKLIILIFSFFVFCGNSCNDKEKHRLYIQNNSDEEIIVQHVSSKSTGCLSLNRLKLISRREYEDIIYSKMVKPKSIKEMKHIVGSIRDSSIDSVYIWIFYRVDLDTMPCEEFVQKFPLKKEWNVTLADLEAANFELVLVYTPETQEE